MIILLFTIQLFPHRYKELHQWASISPANLEEVLQWCVDNRGFLPGIGIKARAVMYANFTRETIAQEAKTRIEEIILTLNTEGLSSYRKRATRKSQVHQQEQKQHEASNLIESVRKNTDRLEHKLIDLSNDINHQTELAEMAQDLLEKDSLFNKEQTTGYDNLPVG